jgi:hypothetical protein
MARFQFLLRHEGWPEAVSWTTADQVVVFPMRTTCIYRPGRPDEHGAARARFDSARDRGVAIEIHGVGHLEAATYAVVRPIEVLGQGEAMFLEDNVKVVIAATPTRVVVTSSRVRWWAIETRHRRWIRSIGAPLDAA